MYSDRNQVQPDAIGAPAAASIRITPQPVRRQVEERLRRAIIDGAFAAGQHLSDRTLCGMLGVSRSIVREAVRLLEAEGLVTVVPHRGPFVAHLSAAEAAQVYEVRVALEGLAGAGFALRAADDERIALRRAFEALARFDPVEGQHALLEAKRRFYDVLLRGSRNDHAARMLGQLMNRNTRLRATSLSAPGRLPDMVAEIGRIVDAVERRDAEAARAACQDHVHAAAAVALRILKAQEAAQEGPSART